MILQKFYKGAGINLNNGQLILVGRHVENTLRYNAGKAFSKA